MAKAKKKPAKKAGKKTAKSSRTGKTPKAKSKPRTPRPVAEGFGVTVSPELDARLQALALSMEKTMEELLLQALTEFADAWEDHQRTVAALRDTDDRVQLAVPKD
jgi:hypothetical protein